MQSRTSRPGTCDLRPATGTVALLAAMLAVHNAHRMAVVPLFDELRGRFATDYSGVGTLFAAYVLGYALCQALVGLVGDRYDPKFLLVWGLLLSASLSALFAAAPTYLLALATRFLLGCSGALLYTPAMKLGITLFRREERGRVLGTIQAGAGLGIVGALSLVPLGAAWFGLAGGFFGLSLCTAAVLPPAIALLPDAPRGAPAAAEESGTALGRRADFRLLLVFSFTGLLAGYGVLTWLPTYLTSTFGLSAVRAGSLTAIANVALLVAAPLVGMLADLPRGRTGVLLGGAVLACAAYVALIPFRAPGPALVIAALVGVSLAATTAPLMLFAGERFGAGETARVVGLLATAAQLGTALSGVVFGTILSYGGRFEAIWLTCTLLAVVRLAVLLYLLAQDRLIPATRRYGRAG